MEPYMIAVIAVAAVAVIFFIGIAFFLEFNKTIISFLYRADKDTPFM